MAKVMSPGKIIGLSIAASLALNGSSVALIANMMTIQGKAIATLRGELYTKTDDRYRRAEAITAHSNLKDRIVSVEKIDYKIEEKLDGHIRQH